MSAEILRRAASLMRERAEAATPGPWSHDGQSLITQITGNSERMFVTECYGDAPGINDAQHIASWHPAVALAVADLLDRLACSCHPADDDSGHCVPREALTVARAYLGDPA